jgi:hypothetical protein
VVNRGPSLSNCSAAIVAAVVADARAREQRDEAARGRQEEVFEETQRHPLKVAWVEPPK